MGSIRLVSSSKKEGTNNHKVRSRQPLLLTFFPSPGGETRGDKNHPNMEVSMKHHPNKLRTIVILCLFTIGLSYGQEKQQESNSLKEGAWALEFGIGDNFTGASPA